MWMPFEWEDWKRKKAEQPKDKPMSEKMAEAVRQGVVGGEDDTGGYPDNIHLFPKGDIVGRSFFSRKRK